MIHFCSLFIFILAARSSVMADCDVIPITQWSGHPSKRVEMLAKPVNLVVIQHTVTQECWNESDCERLVRSIQAYQKSQGLTDISISFLVGGNGKIYEGSGWHVGAHTRGYNNRSIGVSFLGDYREKLPSPIALQAAQDFLNCAVYKNNLGIHYSLVGHQQLQPTLSPGATLQKHIQTWPHWIKDVRDL